MMNSTKDHSEMDGENTVSSTTTHSNYSTGTSMAWLSDSDAITPQPPPPQNDGNMTSTRLPQQHQQQPPLHQVHPQFQSQTSQQQQSPSSFPIQQQPQHYPQQEETEFYPQDRRPSFLEQQLPTAMAVPAPSSSSSSSVWGFCTVPLFCYCVQIINCALVFALIALAVQEYPKIEELESQVEADQAQIANLEQEVREKQETQIQEIQQEVAEEQQFNFLSLAGIFTLLTCLISMFHMSSHLTKMNQPNIQRKVIAILWMSPIYSVTSFFTLWFPSIGGWMAIIKDFYEAYCIYTFLSFLIAVLGHGDRDQAVDVLSKHAAHLQRPTSCLSCFYDPSPDVSDHAMANAVVTQCQIYCLQFTFLRPLTTVIYVLFVRDRNKEDDSSTATSTTTATGTTDTTTTASSSNGDSDENDTDNNNSQSATAGDGTNGDKDDDFDFDKDQSVDTGDMAAPGNNGTRWLDEDSGEQTEEVLGDRNQQSGYGSSMMENEEMNTSTDSPDGGQNIENDTGDEGTWIPTPTSSPLQDVIGTLAPSIISNIVPTLAPTLAVLVPTLSDNNATTPTMSTDDIVFDTPTIGPAADDGETAQAIVKSTEAYFKSPGFALAMVVNVSVFFAFSGLLKFYHAVRDDLQWIRPWPKFLSIKAVVFLTFWQGLMILIFVVVLADPSEKVEATARAQNYQNLLICLEMLLFSLWQWCVFPAEEWEPNYQPKEMHNPGLGIKDFAQEVGTIMQKGAKKTRRGRKRGSRRKSAVKEYSGVYQRPGNVAEQYDEEDFNDEDDGEQSGDGLYTDSDHSAAATGDYDGTGIELSTQQQPPSLTQFQAPTGETGDVDVRDRSFSDGGHKADDEYDSDLEML